MKLMCVIPRIIWIAIDQVVVRQSPHVKLHEELVVGTLTSREEQRHERPCCSLHAFTCWMIPTPHLHGQLASHHSITFPEPEISPVPTLLAFSPRNRRGASYSSLESKRRNLRARSFCSCQSCGSVRMYSKSPAPGMLGLHRG